MVAMETDAFEINIQILISEWHSGGSSSAYRVSADLSGPNPPFNTPQFNIGLMLASIDPISHPRRCEHFQDCFLPQMASDIVAMVNTNELADGNLIVLRRSGHSE